MNLLKETIEDIELNGHTIESIIFIGAEHSGHSCTWEEFQRIADVEYDNGYGGQEVATDLVIVFSDGSMMTRCEYDGSEWWGYRTPFVIPKKTKTKSRVVRRDCLELLLAEMNI